MTLGPHHESDADREHVTDVFVRPAGGDYTALPSECCRVVHGSLATGHDYIASDAMNYTVPQ